MGTEIEAITRVEMGSEKISEADVYAKDLVDLMDEDLKRPDVSF